MTNEHMSLLKVAILMVLLLSFMHLVCGCTISFQNISTHGTAQDLIDENQTADPKITTDLQVPM